MSETQDDNTAAHTATHTAAHDQTHAMHNPAHATHAKKGNSVADVIKANELYIKLFFVYLILALITFWPVTLNINSAIRSGFGDAYQSMFNLWWFPHALFTLHQNPYFTLLLHYPVGSNLATQTLSPIAGILFSPLYSLSPTFTYNLLFLLGYALSGVFMFLLADYLLKNKYAAFIAGLIFAFSPMHIAQASHLDWTMIEWVPLFILFYIRMFRERSIKYALLAALSFVLLTFMGDIQQGIMMVVFAIVLTILLVIFEFKDVIKRSTMVNFGVFVVVALILSSPILLLLVPYLNSSALSSAQQDSLISSNMQWSDNIASYFLPSYYNGIFQGLSKGYASTIYQLTYQGVQYTINVGERVSYFGYTILALCAIGVYFDYKQNRFKNSKIWIVVLVLFGWLSLGPYLQFYSTNTSIPGIYLLYRNIPLFNIIREPGRFDMIVTIALAVLAALGFSKLVTGKDHKTALTYMAVVSILILIEYNGIPLTSSYASNFTESTVISGAYYNISQVTGNFSVLFLPNLPNESATPNAYTGLATYYVTAIQHPIIGGYTSRTNYTQELAASSIPLVQSAAYLEYGYGFVYPSPILENYTNTTLLFISNPSLALPAPNYSAHSIGFVSMFNSAYNATDQAILGEYLESVFGPPVAADNTSYIFSTEQAIQTKALRSVTSYTIGNWTPGYDYCAQGEPCNTTIATAWWGDNPRGIVIYSPTTQNVSLSMLALSPFNGTQVQIYVDGSEAPATNITLNQRETNFTFNLAVPQGLNQLIFYAPSVPENVSDFAYGIKNITVTPK